MAEENMFAAARTGAGLTQAKAAYICGISIEAYRSREKRPDEFRIRELSALAKNMGESSRKILADAVLSLFLPK